ncbi:hypothetical protein AMC82_CH02533 [Rhizobium phaseoli]|uniref:Uncharacterized protein n=2 Tax=Rhizobium TaxID=379 RepID=B3PQX4_RHIE6|nr:hypothetical protein RHECIAT_CH0002595 [Rhizobium etli CIAT 652]ANL40967.1 hypothetical protein AMC88_CH02588 [Rhizobium phaseoli]MDH6650646.1 hypothetical protein [Rhizobium esperanzae]ANL53702.1 hypothetical protein AMC86_CH02573 [Rhizobium phaseoli]ANL59955.1 hypothetical protein AMC85_CH02587 [Rhizobium phaseoli]
MVQAGEGATCRKSHWKCMVINRGGTPLSLRIVRLFTNAAGKARRIRWHDQGRPDSGPPRSRPITASQETCLPCRARSPPLGKRPAASTEVVLAERMNSALPCAVRRWGFPFSPAGRRWPEGSDEGAARQFHPFALRVRSAHSRLSRSPPQPPAGTFSPLGRRGIRRHLALPSGSACT